MTVLLAGEEQGSTEDIRRVSVERLWGCVALRRFLISQAGGQSADASTALVLAGLLVVGGDGVVDADSLLQTLAVATIPYAVVGPFAGVIADRWPRRRTLLTAHLLRSMLTVVALLAVVTANRVVGLLVAACLLSAARIVYAVRAAALPLAAPTGRLVAADSAALYVGMTAAVLGATVGGLAAGGAVAVVLVGASMLQALAAFGFASVPTDLGGGLASSGARWTLVLRRVARLVTSSPTRFVIVATTTVRAILGASFATFVLLATDRFGLGPDGYLLAVAVTGLGSFSGAVVAARCHLRFGATGVVTLGFAVPSLALVTAAVADRRIVIEAALCAAFLAFQLLRITADATVQGSIADDTRGRVFAMYDVSYNLSYFAGAAFALEIGSAGRASVWFAVFGGSAAVAMIALLWFRGTLHPHRAPIGPSWSSAPSAASQHRPSFARGMSGDDRNPRLWRSPS